MKFRKAAETKTKTINLAGSPAYQQTPDLELVSLVLTSFVEDKYYQSASEQLERLKNLIAANPDKKFVAQLMIYARNEFGMRSITHAGIIELLKHAKGEPWLKNAIAATIRRPDDLLEMVAYWITTAAPGHDKCGLPGALRKGITIGLEKFDAYQLAKYKGNKSDVKMVDIFNLVHPKPKTPERAELYKSLMKGELKSTQTWEAKLSKAGQDGETEEEVDKLKGNAWKELLESKKLGYFALLRNLRNIIEQAPDAVNLACMMLTSEVLIKKSLVLPFRYQTAYDTVESMVMDSSADNISLIRQVMVAIDQAMTLSVKNVPVFEGRTLVVLDTSGSMSGKPIDIGSLFAAAILKSNPAADFMYFSTSAAYVMLNPNDSIATLVKNIKAKCESGGTNFHAIFNVARGKYSRIIILSDMQGWIGDDVPRIAFTNYQLREQVKPHIYSIDLAGHGTMQFPEKNVYCIAGFSEKIFDLIKLLEQDKQAMIHKIKTIEIKN